LKRSSACSSRSCVPRTSGPSRLWTTPACYGTRRPDGELMGL
jgi:hypothetical protein